MAEPRVRLAAETVVAAPEASGPDAALPADRLLLLTTFLSPAFPVGGFSYSHGLEWVIHRGTVRDAATLSAWLADLIEAGSLRADAVLFAAAHRAVAEGNEPALAAVAELAAALPPSKERHLESTAQGAAFARAVLAAWPLSGLTRLAAAQDDALAYPVAVGATLAEAGLGAEPALATWLNATLSTLVSVAVRAVPLGQSDGLRVVAGLQPLALVTARWATGSTLDDLSSATVLSDIASMQHEHQYSRLFRS